jgi:hypothetical protein
MKTIEIILPLTCLGVLGIILFMFLNNKKIETGYFPETVKFPSRHTRYREQELTSVDEIMNQTRIPYYPRRHFPKTELPLP